MKDDRLDCRSEWYRDFDITGGGAPRIPGLYWLGLLASMVWLVVYLLIYPSVPLPGGHWRGLGELGGCRPWTAICEQMQKQRLLDVLREPYLRKIASLPLTALADDLDTRDYISHAARIPYLERCAACHGEGGNNQKIHGSAEEIYRAIVIPTRHQFGLSTHIDETTAKILAVYAARGIDKAAESQF